MALAYSHVGSSLDLELRWIVSAKYSRYHPNRQNIYHWESQPTSPLGHSDSGRTWTSTTKVSRIAYRDCEHIKLSDSTIPLEKKGTGVSRIVVHDEKCEDQVLPAPGSLTPSAVAGGDDHGNDPAGERL